MFTIRWRDEARPVTLTVDGAISFDTVGHLSSCARSAARDGHDVHEVVIDLSDMSGIDSAGVVGLVLLKRELASLHVELSLVEVDPALRAAFTKAGLTTCSYREEQSAAA